MARNHADDLTLNSFGCATLTEGATASGYRDGGTGAQVNGLGLRTIMVVKIADDVFFSGA